ncbi:MAG: efflux RND transporter permease subunit, partial [Gammaproteobacteria bacterium]|nr:efflux RND transporter permease subunit [Gammaproteobacteria bacterium]
MNISAPFIKRPIATTLLALGLAIAGGIAFLLLPVASLPQVDFPTITVSAGLPGASPETMATSVATPLERQIGRIAGITQITSTSTLGSTGITVQFDLSRNIDGAARDVQAAINAARGQLPINLPSNPTYRKVNPADSPILILALTSNIYTQGQMYDAASTLLAQALSQVNGVGQVIVGGSSLPAVRIELNPNALNSYNISLQDVANAISSANANIPKGHLNTLTTTSDILSNDQLFKATEYRHLIITYRNNNAVRLSDVATVNDSVENVRNAGLSNGKPSVLVVIFKAPGANVLKTVDNINKELPRLTASIPRGIDVNIAMDRTTTLRASLHDVEITLLIAIILVILVVYIFLKNFRAMLIPSVAVPLSLLGTFGVMFLLGYTLDNLSLMALTISTGFVVDDAVVVLENITRHIEEGVNPLQAAYQGAKEVGFTVVSMSTSLIAVFIPILLMGGIVGRLFREFAITLSTAIVISLIVSLTVTPMMCARLLKKTPSHKKVNKPTVFQRLHNHYENTLNWALNHQAIMLLITLSAVLMTIFLFITVPKGFFPQQDTGRIQASLQADQDISFQAMQQKLFSFVDMVKTDPAVSNVVGFVGGGGGSTTNSGSVFITLKPLQVRHLSADEIINRLRKKLTIIKGATLYMQAAQDLVVGGRLGNAQFQYTLSADHLEELNQWAPKILAKILTLPGIIDVNTDQLNNGLQVYVDVDRDTASRLGINNQLIDQTLYDAFGQSQISTMYTALNQYHVIMEVAPEYWQNPIMLNQFHVKSTNGNEVPLSAFSHFSSLSTLLSVNHQGQSAAATISFNLTRNVALGDAVSLINNAIANMHVPASVQTSFQGTAQAFQSSLANEPYLILAALLSVYIVLGILYESLIHPITILSTLPSAG